MSDDTDKLREEVVRLKLDAVGDVLHRHFTTAGLDTFFADLLVLRAMTRIEVSPAGNVLARNMAGEAITGAEPLAVLADEVMASVPADHRPRGLPSSNTRSSPGAAYFDGIREQVRTQQERARGIPR